MPGVVRVLSCADIPKGGRNDIGSVPGQEKLFLDIGDSVAYVGQPVALVLADTFQHALMAAYAVTVAVSAPASPPIFTIADAIAAKSFYPNGTPQRFSPPGGVVKGDVDAALASSAKVISGTLSMGGQKHLYMEVQNAVGTPVDDTSIQLEVSAQCPGMCQYAAFQITGLPANRESRFTALWLVLVKK